MNFKKMRKEIEAMTGDKKQQTKAFVDVAEVIKPTKEELNNTVYMESYNKFINMK